CRHRFRLAEDGPEVSEVRLDIYPDGGMGRLRLFGDLTPAAEQTLRTRWSTLR
ncbi:MAG: allantoicase, partial [Actinomycetia bacterium]|nr:allantoicase [Actinomycetes bacterium]